jgi:hypothetical protein
MNLYKPIAMHIHFQEFGPVDWVFIILVKRVSYIFMGGRSLSLVNLCLYTLENRNKVFKSLQPLTIKASGFIDPGCIWWQQSPDGA